jgi:glycosyltransferase involved in cell wall biosynthesis
MESPLIAVLIDTYNYGRYIDDAIHSILTQDFPKEKMQVIIVDDGSTDDTPEKVKKYGSAVQYFWKPNGGQASAFNYGFEKVQTELVTLLDADDYFLPNKISRIAEEFHMHPEAGMIYHRLLRMESSGLIEELPLVPVSGFVLDDGDKLLTYDLYPTSSLAFRLTVVSRVLPMPSDIRLQADAYLDLLMPLLAPVVGISTPLAVYRVHGHNLFHCAGGEEAATRKRRAYEMFMLNHRAAMNWTRANANGLKKKETKVFLSRWPLIWEQDMFRFEPPTRYRFFRSLVKRNWIYRSRQTWRYTILNFMMAIAGLALGYKNAGLLEDWRNIIVETMRTLPMRGRSNT